MVTTSQAFSPVLTMRQLTSMLRARRRHIVGIVTVTILAVMGITLAMPQVWTASSDVYIDYRESDPLSGKNFSPMLDDSYMQTQIDMIRSHVVADEAIKSLGLHSSTAYREWVLQDGVARADDRLITLITRNTKVEKGSNSRVLSVSYDASSPQEAQQAANAIVQAYITVSRHIAFSSARSLLEQYNAQLDELRKEANTIQENLTAYRQKTGIIGDNGDRDQETRLLEQLNATLNLVQTQRLEAEARRDAALRQIKNGVRVEDLPESAQVTTLNDQKSKLADVERRINEAQSSLGKRHPTLVSLRAERAEMQKQIGLTARAALGGLEAEAGRLATQERILQQQVAAQNAKVLERLIHHDQIATYLRQQASVEQVYRSALQKYDGLLMASNINAPNLSVLRQAEIPSVPSRPRILMNLAAGLLAGTLMAFCLALLLELLHRRVRCVDDILQSTSGTLLGSIAPAANKHSLAKESI